MRKTPLKRGTKQMKRTSIHSKSPNKKPKKRDPIKTMRNKCDKLLTPIIKIMYPECELCGSPTQVAHHHFKKSTSNACRYYIPNLIGLCTPCHMRLHSDEILWAGRVIEIRGMDWLADLEEEKKKEVRTTLGWYTENYERLNEML